MAEGPACVERWKKEERDEGGGGGRRDEKTATIPRSGPQGWLDGPKSEEEEKYIATSPKTKNMKKRGK